MLTVLQRREAYKAVTEELLASPYRSRYHYLVCPRLARYAVYAGWVRRLTDLVPVADSFPEFGRQKPPESGMVWWPEGDKQSRINALSRAIELTYADYPYDPIEPIPVIKPKSFWQWARYILSIK